MEIKFSFEKWGLEIFEDQGIYGCRFSRPIVWDLDLTRVIVNSRLELTKGKPSYCLVEGKSLLWMTPEARKYLANEGARGKAALAMVIYSPVERMIASFYLRFKPVDIPTKTFNSYTEAREWLLEVKAMHQEQSRRA